MEDIFHAFRNSALRSATLERPQRRITTIPPSSLPMPFNTAFILPSIGPSLRTPWRQASIPLRTPVRTPVRHRTPWLAAASGTNAGTPPSTPFNVNSVSGSTDDAPQQPELDGDGEDAVGSLPVQPVSASLGDAAIAVDPIKNIPTVLIDASGALQLDDGSFSAEAIIPRRLVRRGSQKPDFARVRSQLAAGFDSGVGSTVLLTSLFGVWYWANTAFNVLNKQVLEVFPFPMTCTLVQFAVASLLMASVWLLRVKKPPRFNRFVFKAAAPLAVLHAAGFLLTNMSLGKVSVAFTHTVKSTEPFFSVALTPSILGDVPTWGILGSLFPIVAGVAIASATDVSFNWPGFLSAIGSNLALQWRNILSKRLMDNGSGKKQNGRKLQKIMSLEEEETFNSLDNVNLFSTMTILAFLWLAPVCLLWEGLPLLTQAVAPSITGMSTSRLMQLLVVGGVCRCVDVLTSYMILKRVSPITHSIGNCVKRAVVIIASIFFFKTRMTSLNIIGTALALTGVLIYSVIVSACKQNTFGPDSAFCRPIYTEEEVELIEGGGI